MKLNWKRLSLVLAFILFLAFGFWYTQETTIQDHAPELDPALCQSITARYFVNQKGDRDGERKEVTIQPGDPAFVQLVGLVRNQKFSKSLSGLLPLGSRSVRLEEGDFQWELHFNFNTPITTPDGNGHAGPLLQVHNWYGTLNLTFAHLDEIWRDASTGNKTNWSVQVLEAIQSAEGTGT